MDDLSYSSKVQTAVTGRMMALAAVLGGSLLLAGCEARKAQAPGNPPNPGPRQVVTLIPSGTAPNITWEVQFPGKQPQAPKTAKTILAQGVGPTMFVVQIAGPQTLSFKDPGGLSVWEGAGAKSSPQQGINSNQILGPIITKDGKLVFFDLNQGNPVTLNYALHFNNGIPSVDPIIENNP